MIRAWRRKGVIIRYLLRLRLESMLQDRRARAAVQA